MNDKLNQVRDLAFLARQKVRQGQSAVYWAFFVQNAYTLLVDNNTNIHPTTVVDYLKGDRYDLFTDDQGE